ncbi:MAG: Holliday junction resolvase RuvX [bacterium]|nr:Holliday junction resolvase RuvX [bacterium]
MRYLGIDYGEKRIGLALSDAEGRIAFPYKTVGQPDDIFEVIAAEGVDAVVIGLPVSLDGTDSEETRAVRAFAAMLSGSLQLPVAFENEAFTTKIAEAHSFREHTDAAAAAIILQSYLDRQESLISKP